MNIEEAEQFYKRFLCMEYGMWHDETQMYKEFEDLNIDERTKEKWKEESWLSRYQALLGMDMEEKCENLYGLMDGMPKITPLKLLNLICDIKAKATPKQASRLVWELVGSNSTKTHGGLIEVLYNSYRMEKAEIAIQTAFDLICIMDQGDSHNTIGVRGYLLEICDCYGYKVEEEVANRLRQREAGERFQYYLEGAEEKNKFAMKQLSVCYQEGFGCSIDKTKAAYWRRMSEEE